LLWEEQSRWVRATHLQALEQRATSLARQLEAGHADLRDPEAVAGTMGAILGLRVTLIDSLGVVRGDSDVPRERLASVENHAGRPEVRDALAGRVGRATRSSATLGREFTYVAVRARLPAIAVVRVAEPVAEAAQLNRTLSWLSVAATALALIAAI